MKISPLQLGKIQYTDVVARANAEIDEGTEDQNLPVDVVANVSYHGHGEHFATVWMKQESSSFPYTIEVRAFVTFMIDVEGCKEAYKNSFNPAVVAINVARLLYSASRELISGVTARAPYGAANIPTLIIEPADVTIRFEKGKRDEILTTYFGLSADQLSELKERAAQKKKERLLLDQKQSKAKKAKTPK